MEMTKTKQSVDWLLLLVMVATTLWLDSVLAFVLSALYLAVVLFKNNFKLRIPNVPGIKLYLLCIMGAFIVGMLLYAFRSVARDFFYCTLTLIWIFIGNNIVNNKNYYRYSLYKTLCLYAVIVSSWCFVAFVFSQDWTFDGIRSVFTIGVYDIGFIFPIIILNTIFSSHYAFSKKIDTFILIFISIHIFLSIGRISILMPLLLVCIIFILVLQYQKGKEKSFRKIVFLICIITLLAIAVFFFVSDDVLFALGEKVFNTFQEIDSSQVIDSTQLAMNNWRGYEVQAAIKQWKSSSIIEQIFGSGLGKGIHIEYIPYSWAEADAVQNNQIPLLHNSFYTSLIKFGIIGTGALITIFIGTIWKSLKGLRRGLGDANRYIMLIALSVGGVLTSYIVNGVIGKIPFLVWGLMMGILSSSHSFDTETF